jgi:RimJ/RimL family protein N-acetyltransferase
MPDFSRVTLETAGLCLRPLEHDDSDALYAIHSDPEVMKYSPIRPWTSAEQANELVEGSLTAMRAGSQLCFGIVSSSACKVVGTCTLFHIYKVSRRAEVGFVLAKSFWGRGYMTEALSTLIDYGFSVLNMNRIEADTDPRNLAATKLLERLGFVKEGQLRERWIVEGEKSDSAMYGLLRRDWKRST